MSYNKSLFMQMRKESKQKKTQPKPKDRIVDSMGQLAHPGQVTRIPSNRITMQGVPYPVLGVGNNGQQQMMYPGQEYAFPGSQYVDEYPMMQAQDGIQMPHLPNVQLNLPKYNKSPDKNFGVNPYMFGFNPQRGVNIHGIGAQGYLNILNSKKNKFGLTGNVNSVSVGYPGGMQLFGKPQFSSGLRFTHTFQNGGEPTPLDLAKIKVKMAMESHFGNPSARRMTTPYPQDLVFKLDAGPDKGKMGRGTHWMYNEGDYAVPIIQEGTNGKLFFNKNASPFDREAMRFDSPEDAASFAEYYKYVAPMMRNNFQNGGPIVVPYNREYTDREYQDYNKFYEDFYRPPYLRKDDRFDKYFHKKLNELPGTPTYSSDWERKNIAEGNITYYDRQPKPKAGFVDRKMDNELIGYDPNEKDPSKKAEISRVVKAFAQYKPSTVLGFRNGGDISIPNLEEGSWLDRYDEGGFTTDETTRPPIYVTNPNDPRLNSFQSEYEKKYPPIYVTNPKDPRIGYYAPEGNQYIYKSTSKSTSKSTFSPLPQLKMVRDRIGIEPLSVGTPIITKEPKIKANQSGDYVLRFSELNSEGQNQPRELFFKSRKEADDMMNFLLKENDNRYETGRYYNNLSTQGNYQLPPYRKGGQLQQFAPGGFATTPTTTKFDWSTVQRLATKEEVEAQEQKTKKPTARQQLTNQTTKTNKSTKTTSTTTQYNMRNNVLDWEQLAEQKRLDEIRRTGPQLNQAQPERPWYSKAAAILTHPLTAWGYNIRGERMPDYFERGSVNPYDRALQATAILAGARGLGFTPSAISTGLSTPILGIPGVTTGNLIGLGFGLKGANDLGKDVETGYYSSNAPLIDKIARGTETGLNMAFSPGVLPGAIKGFNAVKNHPLVYSIPHVVKNNAYGNYASALTLGAMDAASHPLLLKIPGIKDFYKWGAFKVGSQSKDAFRSMPGILKALVKPIKSYKGTNYKGLNINNVLKDDPRNLLRNYIYQDARGFDVSDIPIRNLDPRHTLKHGDIKKYKLNTYDKVFGDDAFGEDLVFNSNFLEGKVMEALQEKEVIPSFKVSMDDQYNQLMQYVKEKGPISFGREQNIIGIDDIGGHMQFIDYVPANKYNPEGLSVTTQDLWKFEPKSYGQKWDDLNFYLKNNELLKSGKININSYLQAYKNYKQASLMEKAGKPFILNDTRRLVRPRVNEPLPDESSEYYELAPPSQDDIDVLYIDELLEQQLNKKGSDIIKRKKSSPYFKKGGQTSWLDKYN